MNFINDFELAQRFKHKKVLSKEVFFYFAMWVIFLSSSHLYALVNETGFLSSAFNFTSLIMKFIFICFLYKVNKQGDDQNFVERYISLYFPISIQMLLIHLGVMSLFLIKELIFGESGFSAMIRIFLGGSLFSTFVGLLLNVYAFLRLKTAFEIAASGSEISKSETLSDASKGQGSAL